MLRIDLKYSLVDAGLEAYLPTRSAYKAWCSHVLQIVIALRTGHAADRSIEKILSSEAPIANDWINGVSAVFFGIEPGWLPMDDEDDDGYLSIHEMKHTGWTH